jgi:hypothetical protein
MAMAQNERVQRARIDLQQIKVVDQGFCEAEVHESAPPFLSALRLNMQREAELALIRVLLGGLSLSPQPKRRMSTFPTFAFGATAN